MLRDRRKSILLLLEDNKSDGNFIYFIMCKLRAYWRLETNLACNSLILEFMELFSFFHRLVHRLWPCQPNDLRKREKRLQMYTKMKEKTKNAKKEHVADYIYSHDLHYPRSGMLVNAYIGIHTTCIPHPTHARFELNLLGAFYKHFSNVL